MIVCRKGMNQNKVEYSPDLQGPERKFFWARKLEPCCLTPKPRMLEPSTGTVSSQTAMYLPYSRYFTSISDHPSGKNKFREKTLVPCSIRLDTSYRVGREILWVPSVTLVPLWRQTLINPWLHYFPIVQPVDPEQSHA